MDVDYQRCQEVTSWPSTYVPSTAAPPGTRELLKLLEADNLEYMREVILQPGDSAFRASESPFSRKKEIGDESGII